MGIAGDRQWFQLTGVHTPMVTGGIPWLMAGFGFRMSLGVGRLIIMDAGFVNGTAHGSGFQVEDGLLHGFLGDTAVLIPAGLRYRLMPILMTGLESVFGQILTMILAPLIIIS